MSSPESALLAAEEHAVLASTLGELPEIYREPLLLFYQEEISTEEIARALEISPAAARQRLSRGRAQLRDRLEGALEGALRRARPGVAFTAAVVAGLGCGAGHVGCDSGLPCLRRR